MAIISFWSGENKESAQTLSMVAVATYMAIEHNYRILVIDGTFKDDTLERCFWNMNPNKRTLAKLQVFFFHILYLLVSIYQNYYSNRNRKDHNSTACTSRYYLSKYFLSFAECG